MITEQQFREILNAQFGGVLRKGSHMRGQDCCVIELHAAALGIPWTADPSAVRDFDFTALNDIDVDDMVRTDHLLPVLAAYAGSLDWPEARQRAVANRLVVLTVQRLIAELPGLSEDIRQQCRTVETVKQAEAAAVAARAAAEAARAAGWAAALAAADAAEAAARAAGWAAAWAAADAAEAAAWAATRVSARAAADAAEAAARAAADAAEAAARAAAERIFIGACQVWVDAVTPDQASDQAEFVDEE